MTPKSETTQDAVLAILRGILKRKGIHGTPERWSDETTLFEDGSGVGLDSMDTVELSTELEERFGKDPFTAARSPRTIGDIIRFYDPR